MAAEDTKSLIRSLIEKITAMQIAVSVIGLALIASLTWFIVDRGKVLSDNKDFIPNFVTFLVAIGILAIVLLAVLFVIFGNASSNDGGDSIASQVIKIVAAISPMQLASTIIGLTVIVAIAWFMSHAFDVAHAAQQAANAKGTDNVLLSSDAARGIITFSVAIVTVALAMMLMFFLIFSGSTADIKDRFTFGKDVLMVFVGILGTIMGFYYAENRVGKDTAKDIGIAAAKEENKQTSSPGSIGDLEKAAYAALFKLDYSASMKAFNDAYQVDPTWRNIDETLSILKKHKAEFDAAATDVEKQKPVWQAVFCDIYQGAKTHGMSVEQKSTSQTYCQQGVPAIPPVKTPAPDRKE